MFLFYVSINEDSYLTIYFYIQGFGFRCNWFGPKIIDMEIFSKDHREIDFKLAVNNFLGTEESWGSETVA